VVGQTRALHLAVRNWRRAPRHTALGGLLDGALRVAWRGHGDADADGPDDVWEGLLGAGSGPEAPAPVTDAVGPGPQPTGAAARR
jgi:hypothetical protein